MLDFVPIWIKMQARAGSQEVKHPLETKESISRHSSIYLETIYAFARGLVAWDQAVRLGGWLACKMR